MSDIVIFSYAFHADLTIDGMFQSCSQTVLYNIFSWFFYFCWHLSRKIVLRQVKVMVFEYFISLTIGNVSTRVFLWEGEDRDCDVEFHLILVTLKNTITFEMFSLRIKTYVIKWHVYLKKKKRLNIKEHDYFS